MDKTKVSAGEVVAHLKNFGLATKPPEPLEGGAALGLKLERIGGELQFRRVTEIVEIPYLFTKRELFSLCGKLVGHYPVVGWLHVASSYIKRHAEGLGWGGQVGEATVS